MATVAQLWDEPTTRSGGSEDVAPKKSKLSTYVAGTQIGSAPSSSFADLWESTPTTEKTETKQTKGVVANALETAFKARDIFRGAIAEPIATLATGAVAAPLAAATGIVAAARSGQFGNQQGIQAGEQQAQNLMQQMMYQPKTKTGQNVIQSLQSAFEASKLPPIGIPEAQSLAATMPNKATIRASLPEFSIERQLPKGTVTEAASQTAGKQTAAGSVGAAKAEFNPYTNQITGEEAARGQFPQVKLSKTAEDVHPQEQATRAEIATQILQEGGVDASQVRPGVITGNENTLRNEHTKAKMANPTPEGELYKQQIANEQVALSNYAQKRVENTGASPTLVTPYERGERINSAFAGDEGLAGFFKGEKRKLYDDVKQKVGENPITTNHVEELLADKQFKAGLGLKGNESVGRSAEELINHAKTIGFKDEMGNVHGPNTVGAWTAVQKSLNENWTPQNAAIIRKINQAIERDIGQAGGLELLKKADSLHQAEKVLFGSKGIKQVFGDIDPNGVQTATAFDAIPQKLNSMPLDQWRHIYDTAEKVSKGTIFGPVDKATGLPKWEIKVPEELRVSAQSAMNEMRGNIAREIYQAGASKAGEWNQNAVNKILNARADKIKLAFTPEEQNAFHTLNVGGYLMPGVHGYEGAGQQTRRVGMVEGNLGKIGTTLGASAGGVLGGAPGAAIGGYLGGKAGVAGSEAIGARALQKQAQQSKAEMQKAAKLGSKLSDIGKD
jgi:hypothetical protein